MVENEKQAAPKSFGAEYDIVRDYWNSHLHDISVVTATPGSLDFFEQLNNYRFGKLHYLPELVDYSGYQGKKVLEVGCGAGVDLVHFARGGADVTGIDLADVSINLARENFAHRNLSGEFQVMNGEAMDFADDSFDAVYCHTVLMYTPNIEKMIQEIHRVLKPGGLAIFQLFNRKSWLKAMSAVVQVEVEHVNAPNFALYSAQEFSAMLKPFSTVEIIPERFPYPTKIHSGLKAQLYNNVFVKSFNLIPKFIVKPLGWHLVSFARK
ncbi:MAG: class I SAM-dependent methyltransferase [Anaerolineae bacterium]